jgi:hypothetical protein
MANKFKYNKTGAEANSIFKGNWAIDNTPVNSGGGPSSVTSFYHGANVPAGGYSIYNNGTVFTAASDTQLLGKVAQLGGDTGSVNAALQWLSTQSNCVVLNKDFENIVTDGLILNLDASYLSSYVDNQPTVNLLYSAGAYNLISGAGDIYGRCTKTDLGGGKFRFVNNGSGDSTIRVYTNQADLIAGATYACSVYFENLYGSLSIDWCDVGITGTNSSTSPSGRLGGYSSRATYDGPYYFLDINLSTRGEVTLFNPQVEYKSYVTAFVNGTRTQNTTWYDLSLNPTNTSIPAGAYSNNTINYINNSSAIGPVSSAGAYNNTMECWFYVPSGGSYAGCCQTIFGTYWFRTFLIGQGLYTMIGFWTGSTYTYQHPAFGISYDAWHCAVGVRRDNRYLIWIDGVEMYNGDFGSGLSLYDAVGSWSISDPSHSNIKVAAARVYNRGLTDSEILQNYNSTKTRFGL